MMVLSELYMACKCNIYDVLLSEIRFHSFYHLSDDTLSQRNKATKRAQRRVEGEQNLEKEG